MSELLKIRDIRLFNTRRLLNESGLSRADFAEKVGVSYNLMSQYIGKNPTKAIGDETADKIEVAFNKPSGYLDQSDLSRLNIDITPVDDYDDDTPLAPDEVEIPFYKDFRLSCGSGSIIEAKSSDIIPVRIKRSILDSVGAYKSSTFSTKVKDNSMYPEIKDGDTVYVDKGKNYIKDGKVFAIEHGGLFRCKRLYSMPNGGVRIVSDNKDEYPEEILTDEQMDEQNFCVIGWVLRVERQNQW